jgi:hypothetical protein
MQVVSRDTAGFLLAHLFDHGDGSDFVLQNYRAISELHGVTTVKMTMIFTHTAMRTSNPRS